MDDLWDKKIFLQNPYGVSYYYRTKDMIEFNYRSGGQWKTCIDSVEIFMELPLEDMPLYLNPKPYMDYQSALAWYRLKVGR